jgi:hypothetical protein
LTEKERTAGFLGQSHINRLLKKEFSSGVVHGERGLVTPQQFVRQFALRPLQRSNYTSRVVIRRAAQRSGKVLMVPGR